MADAWGGSWGSSWGVSWGSGAAPEPTPDPTRGRGGWGAGLHGPKRRRDYTAVPLSQRDKTGSEPQIVKSAVTVPATVLRPLVDDDEEELMIVLLLQ